jgi:hypothetical protein
MRAVEVHHLPSCLAEPVSQVLDGLLSLHTLLCEVPYVQADPSTLALKEDLGEGSLLCEKVLPQRLAGPRVHIVQQPLQLLVYEHLRNGVQAGVLPRPVRTDGVYEVLVALDFPTERALVRYVAGVVLLEEAIPAQVFQAIIAPLGVLQLTHHQGVVDRPTELDTHIRQHVHVELCIVQGLDDRALEQGLEKRQESAAQRYPPARKGYGPVNDFARNRVGAGGLSVERNVVSLQTLLQ